MEVTLQQQIAFKKANKILGILGKEIKEKVEDIAMAYGYAMAFMRSLKEWFITHGWHLNEKHLDNPVA